MPVMKALSVKQPWASLILNGYKTIETRTWPTAYRGDILICSSKTIDVDAVESLSRKLVVGNIPTGVALCIATITGCERMIPRDEARACCEWYEGAYSWFLSDIRPVEPFPVRGKLGIFDVEVTR